MTIDNVNQGCFDRLNDTVLLTMEAPVLPNDRQVVVPLTLSSDTYIHTLETSISWEYPGLSLSEIQFGPALRHPEGFRFETTSSHQVNLAWNSDKGSDISSTNIFCFLIFDLDTLTGEPFHFSFLSENTKAVNVADRSLTVIEKVTPAIAGDANKYDVEGKTTFYIPDVQAFPGDIIEVPVYVANFKDILGFSATFTWPNELLSFIEITDSNPILERDLNLNINLVRARETGRLAMTWVSPPGRTIEDGEPLFKLRLRAASEEGTAPLGLSNDFLSVGVFKDFRDGNAFFPFFEGGQVQIYDQDVWPGDADKNGIVDREDWLYLGLASGREGPPRSDTSGIWMGTPGLNWKAGFPVSSVNLKHADFNGDGVIELSDSSILIQNFNQRTANYPNTFSKPVAFHLSDPVHLSFSASPDTLDADQQAELSVRMDNLDMGEELLGYAFILKADTTWVKEGTLRFIPNESWLGAEVSTRLLSVDEGQGEVQVAVFGENGGGFFQEEGLGQLFFELNPSPKNFEVDSISLTLEEVVLMSPDERRYLTEGDSITLPVRYLISSTVDRPSSKQLRIFPLPANDRIYLDLENGEITRIDLFDLNGRFLKNYQGENLKEVRLPNLPSGTYLLRVHQFGNAFPLTARLLILTNER